MVNVLVDKIDAIRQVWKHFKVMRLDIFGSALSEDFDLDRSDIDFLVDFGPALRNRYIRDDVNRMKQQLYAA